MFLTLVIICLKNTSSGRGLSGDNKTGVSKVTKENASVGEQLCNTLLQLWDKSYLFPSSAMVFSTLKCLFLYSNDAKIYAMENGFVKTVIEELRDKLTKLKLSISLENEKQEKVKVIFQCCQLNC